MCRILFLSADFVDIATPEMLLMVASALLEENDFINAKKLLDIYMKKHGMVGIEEFLQVSAFCQEHFEINEKINTSAACYRMLKKAESRKEFPKLYGKTVAVVGNGPSQLGKGTGPEIDRHDIVIRFNTYTIDETFCSDYGTKISIWAPIRRHFTCANHDKSRYQMILGHCGMNCPMEYSWTESLVYFLKNTDVYVIPGHVLKELARESRMLTPTSGLRVLYWLKKVVKIDRKNLNVYGFTLNAKQVDAPSNGLMKDKHHYGDENDYTAHHNFDAESNFLTEFLQKS